MQSTPKILFNINDPALRPKTIAVAIDNVDNAIGLVRLKDEKNKSFISLKLFLTAVKFFNLEGVHGSVDAEGYECLHGMEFKRSRFILPYGE